MLTKNIPHKKLRTYYLYIQKNSGNSIKMYYNRDKRIADQVEKAKTGTMPSGGIDTGNSNIRLKRLLVIASLFNEFVPALDTVKDVLFLSEFTVVYDEIIKKYFEGEDLSLIVEKLDPEGIIESEISGKELNFIEQTFSRELAYVRLSRNNELLKILGSDNSPESLNKRWEITVENRSLKEIIVNIKINESEKLEEC